MNTLKNLKNYFSIALCLSFFTLFSGTSFANPTEDKTTVKAREAVENASPDDWMAYAASAEKCLKKNVNLKEAAAWIDTSLSIKETPYNLRLKGLYFEKNNLPEQALEYYVKSLRVGLENDINYKDEKTQMKVKALLEKA